MEYWGRDASYRRPYVAGAVIALAHISATLGQNKLYACYEGLSPVAPEMLDILWLYRADIAKHNTIATIRNFCISDEYIKYVRRRPDPAA